MHDTVRFIGGVAYGWLLALLVPSWALGQSISELTVTSRYDQFSLLRSGGKYTLEGKPIALGQLQEFLDLFKMEIEGDCSGSGKADVTIKAKLGDKLIERKFYVAKRLVGDGKQCATVGGEGIFFLPLHRSWFDTEKTESIALNSPLKILRDEQEIMAVEKFKGEWRNSNPDEFLNWQFFEDFSKSVTDFPVTHRVHKAMAEGRPRFTLLSGKRKLTFIKVTSNLWVLDRPSPAWLIGSNRWSQWIDMERSQWVDRFSSQLKFFTDKGKGIDERKGALATLDGQWSASIREALRMILLDEDEKSEMKLEAIRLMRQTPSKENLRIFVKALPLTNDAAVLEALTQGLRLRYPKGPVIREDTEDEARQSAIRDWQKWWQEFERGP